jgi:exopolysaccharide biosynthesis WecB/TagA/CpsF family protein
MSTVPVAAAPGVLPTIRLFGVDVAAVDIDGAVAHVLQLAQADRSSYLVTMNVDHVVELRDRERFRRAYDGADVRVADGAPIVMTARVIGHRLPGRVTGADLMPRVIAEAATLGLRVAIVGGAPDVNERAIEVLRERHPGLDVQGWSPYGFEDDPDRAEEIAHRLAELKADIVFVCFGAPRSEIWIAEHRHLLPRGVAVCAGAGVDFIAGSKQRAPAWMRRAGLEWAFRLGLEPGRLWRRYLVRDLAFVPVAWHEVRAAWRVGRRGRTPSG